MATRSEVLAWLMDLNWATEYEFIKKFGDEAQELVSSLRDLGLVKYAIRNDISALIPTSGRYKARSSDGRIIERGKKKKPSENTGKTDGSQPPVGQGNRTGSAEHDVRRCS